MHMIDMKVIRNIGIAAHIDAGKTTTTEGILHRAGRTHREGNVDSGNTTTDTDATERERGITIYSAAVSLDWRGHTINLIDTPGHVDFTAEVERSLRVLDGAVAVFDAKEGVEAQSETVWRQCDRYDVPRICFVNKMDKLGADFAMSVQSMRDRISAAPAVMHIPLGDGNSFSGFVDVVRMRAVRYSKDGSFSESDVPQEMTREAVAARSELIEVVADHDDGMAERYLEGEEITPESLIAALRRQTIAGHLHPVLCGSALKKVGIQHLLDAVCDLLPNPMDASAQPDQVSADSGKSAQPFPNPTADMVALVFKVVPEKTGDLTYVRIYSGTLKPSTRVFNVTRGVKENITRLFRMHADKRESISEAVAGDIVAVVGMKKAVTGDTLAPKDSGVMLDGMSFADPVMSMSIEPKTSSDADKLGVALAALSRQDPTFRHSYDADTGQTIISGMGELHLEISVDTLRKSVDCAAGRPKVSYRETITADSGPVEHRHIKQTGGRGQRAIVKLSVEPLPEGEGESGFLFEDQIRGGAVCKQYINAVAKSCAEAMQTGILKGHPMTNVKVTLLDGEEHDVDSSDMAFAVAAKEAFKKAVAKARPRLLEPIMRLTIAIPEECFGSVSADVASRGGMILDSVMASGRRTISAKVPLSRMFGYASDVRSATGGRVSWSMEPACYDFAKSDE